MATRAALNVTPGAVWRALVILFLTALTLVRFCVGWVVLLLASPFVARPIERRESWAGHCLAGLCRRLGATFVKVGQILSTRPDLLPPAVIAHLVTLQDDVGPFPFEGVRETIERDFGKSLEDLFETFDPTPLASASVAQVHAATLLDGREVAVKIRRPNIYRLVDFDLEAMRLGGRLLEALPIIGPDLGLLAPTKSIEEFGRGIRLQLDFTVEADNNRRFRKNFEGDADVVFPGLVPPLCSARVLTMDRIFGKKILDHEGTGADPKRLAAIGFRVLLKMIFEDGFVHADLHPGNLFVTDHEHKVAVLDLGLVGELDEQHRLGLARYFAAFAAGDGATMARLMTSMAPGVGDPTRVKDFGAFQADVQAFAQRYQGKKLGDVQISVVFLEMMDILRRHRVRANAEFTLVNIAIMVTEGIGKQLDPEVDLMATAMPFFARMSAQLANI